MAKDDRAWDESEQALHEEINRLSKENQRKNVAAEAERRREKFDRAWSNRKKAKRERFKLFLNRIALCAAIMLIAGSWSKFGIIPMPIAVLGMVLATGWAALEYRIYSAFRGWAK
jgi:hypothetical protein